MTYDEIIAKVAESTGLSAKLVDRTYRSYWKAIREHIESLPLKQDLSEEELKELRPNVNIPSIGKLYVTYDRHRRIRENYLRITKN